jgi:hypothetical protein
MVEALHERVLGILGQAEPAPVMDAVPVARTGAGAGPLFDGVPANVESSVARAAKVKDRRMPRRAKLR